MEEALERAEAMEDKDVSVNDGLSQEDFDDLQKELEMIKEENEKLHSELKQRTNDKTQMSPNSIEAALEMRSVINPTKSQPSPNHNNFNSENARFAEPTEAEYLRNVLYRYMVERETLGKEIVVRLCANLYLLNGSFFRRLQKSFVRF